MIVADTTFLIDLQRSRQNAWHLSAVHWLENHGEIEIALPTIVLGEFAEGLTNTGHPLIEYYRTNHRILEVDDTVAMTYAQVSRTLRSEGTPIGANDTWIAATTLAHQVPLLTRNVHHFTRVHALEILSYADMEA